MGSPSRPQLQTALREAVLLSVGICLVFLALVTHADAADLADGGGSAGPFQNLLSNLSVVTNRVLIPFIVGIAFLTFVWGMFRYFVYGGANEDEQEKGKNLMLYATLGIVLILIFWGVVNLLTVSTGLQSKEFGTLPTGVETR